ncbi:zinc ribbon domain-containing protein [Prevotella melaninogenica]|uniref:zinc ribbon domain-containing protein n=1 Tax=Prevotella TaxID=838 RepID=UPI00056C8A10|nr:MULTISPECIES: zinc ribbon domain-containing protein [Prevotella]QUB73385.1 zinc ribbon domain-containing protein [Prevotella melaninogenica]
MQRNGIIGMILLLLFSFSFTGCYHKKIPSSFRLPDSIQEAQISRRLEAGDDSVLKQNDKDQIEWSGTRSKVDSLAFRVKHHYSQGFNFVVIPDSLMLLRQQPEEAVNDMKTDSFAVKKGKEVVVADIRILPNDKQDSVWVQIATEDYAFGWIHESQLLKQVVPADPISQFISTFSNIHLLIFLIVISIMGVGYLARKILKKNAHIVHLNDISSFYPTLLAVIVALSAAFYASIQLFAPETWREFYFHPSLNPFSQPLLLNIFLVLVWAMLIISIATIDDVRRLLKSGEALLYLSGLGAVCAVNYIVFSVLTLYYIGYPLLIVYIYYAFRIYLRKIRETYYCGNCGVRLHRKGRCPQCGAVNE